MNYKKSIKILICLLCINNFVFSQSVLFQQGIEFYNKTDFASAREKFLELNEILSKENKVSSEVLYNIGCCYFRENKLGYARYYFELAKKVCYHDKDINYNLWFVKKITNNNSEESFLTQIVNVLSLKEVLVILLLFNFMFFGSLTAEIFIKPSFLRWVKRISFVFLVCFLIVSIIKLNTELKKTGIVLESTSLLSAPEENPFTKSVAINEAKKVVILSEKGDYYAVYLLQDKIQGWVRKDKIGLL
jgi:hypothetical protein